MPLIKSVRILLMLSFLLFTNKGSSQLENFNIEVPYSGTTSILTLDDDGYLWFSIDNSSDYCRYHGHGLTEVHLAELYNGTSARLIIDNPAFIEGKLLVETDTEFSLLDLSKRTLTDLWTYPKGHKINYYLIDDQNSLIVFTTNNKEKTRPVYKRQPNGDFEYQFDLANTLGMDDLDWWSGISIINEEYYFHGRFQGLMILDKFGNKKELELENRKEYEDKLECSMFRVDNQGNLWRTYKDTYGIYNPKSRKFIEHPVSGKLVLQTNCTDMSTFNFELMKILVDQKNRVWFAGGQSNLMMYDPKADKVISFAKKITDIMGGNDGNVHDLEIDRYGNIYGSKRGGIFKISESEQLFESYLVNTNNEDHPIYDYTNNPMFEQVVNYLKPSNIVRTSVNSVVEKDDEIYFNDYRFLYKVDKKTNRAKVMPFYHPVSKLGMHSHNDQLIAASWNELLALDDSYQHRKLEFTPSKLVGIFQQKNRDTWAYGYSVRNSKVRQQKTLFAQVDSETLEYTGNYIDPTGKVNFDSLNVYTVEENEKGDLWLGTRGGLYIIDSSDGIPRKQEFNFDKHGNNSAFISHLYKTHGIKDDSKICISTRKEFAVVNTQDNLVEEYISVADLGIERIYGATFPNENEVWFGSKNGLGYYNFKTKKYINFSYQSGLNENLGSKNLTTLKDGRIALGTTNGLFIYDPEILLDAYVKTEKIEKNIPLSIVSYTYLKGADGTTFTSPLNLDEDHKVQVEYNDKMLSIDMGLMHFGHPGQHLYSYKLDGYDTHWSMPSNDNTINYTSLPPGDYTLKVKANNGSGIWSNDVKSISVSVNEVWYKTWLFLGILFLLLSAIAYALFKHYLFLAQEKLDKKAKIKETLHLKEIDNAKNVFFANISHEFRTPLTVIMGINENIEEHKEEKTLIRRNSHHLLKLVNQLLDLSKLESNKMTLNLSQGDMVAYLRYLTASFYSMAADKQIDLQFETKADKLIMNYDEIRIQQICYNLLSNAIKFTNEEGTVTLSLDEVEYNNIPQLSITVKDTGQGISEKDLSKVFDHFYQVNNSSIKTGEGSGIGLALIKELLDLMGGMIEVKSIVDIGTEFKVYLPIDTELSEHLVESIFEENNEELNQFLTIKESRDLEAVPAEVMSYHFDDSHPVLLLIEDNADVTTYIMSILKDHYQIVLAENGEIGIDKAIEIVPDIIISDVMMPIKDGFEVCKTLKQHPTTDHIPIILLTAKSTINDKVEGLKYGADAYLSKPFHKEELLVRLEQLLLLRKRIQQRYSQQIIAPVSTEPSKEDIFYNKIKSVVFDNLSDSSFGVPELAQQMLMSQTQLFRKTKALLDKTPAIFIRSVRLEKAKEMLSETDMIISKIAQKTGFRDPSYFSRAFSKEYGTSPSDFRK